MSRIQFYFILALFCAVLVAVFAVQNNDPVDITFLFWHFGGISKVLVILVSTVVGALLVLFLGFGQYFEKTRRVRRLEGEVRGLKSELEKLSQPSEPASAAGSTPPSDFKKIGGSG